RGGLVAHVGFWTQARNTTTDAIEQIGFWTGDDDATVTIGGSGRGYIGAGKLIDIDPITAAPGLDVRTVQVRLAAPSGAVEDMVKGYDTRFAPVEIHRMLFDPETRALAGAPYRIFKGLIDGVDFPTTAPGQVAVCVISVVSATRGLTRKLSGKKSAQTWKAAGGDNFRKYGDISGMVPVWWGTRRIDAPSDPKPAPQSNAQASKPDPIYPLGP
ncbi:MAG: hypothetical protein KDE03_18025, partial [Rhodobacteraceae bacterium]|nr:hypothetical protein [Paracoccaceae bacterium]